MEKVLKPKSQTCAENKREPHTAGDIIKEMSASKSPLAMGLRKLMTLKKTTDAEKGGERS